ncbi:MAG TPA: ABC transporter substrate-binding protein, partial [Mobilitalea sp.]|nr:ABC transporter substrate-binding protein [Mobilitalea sp.]
MRKLKKVLCLVLAMSLVVASLSACGKKDTDKSAGDAKTTQGAADGKFYIGGIGPTSGGAAVYGQNVQNGAELAVKEINANGGINGKQIEF